MKVYSLCLAREFTIPLQCEGAAQEDPEPEFCLTCRPRTLMHSTCMHRMQLSVIWKPAASCPPPHRSTWGPSRAHVPFAQLLNEDEERRHLEVRPSVTRSSFE